MHTMTRRTTRTRRKKAVASKRQLNLNAAGIDLGATVPTPFLPLSDLLNNVLRDTPQKANS
jgi:hypothetical protein